MASKSIVNFPTQSFKCCPACGDLNLARYADIHVFCGRCDWDSIAAFVDVGGMDALIYGYELQQEEERFMNLEKVAAF